MAPIPKKPVHATLPIESGPYDEASADSKAVAPQLNFATLVVTEGTGTKTVIGAVCSRTVTEDIGTKTVIGAVCSRAVTKGTGTKTVIGAVCSRTYPLRTANSAGPRSGP